MIEGQVERQKEVYDILNNRINYSKGLKLSFLNYYPVINWLHCRLNGRFDWRLYKRLRRIR